MSPFDLLSKLILGIYHEGHIQAWIRLIFACSISAFVSFFGIFGTTLLGTSSLIISLGTASVSMSVCVLLLWLKSPLTKGIPVLYPGTVDVKRVEQLEANGIVYVENKK